MNEDNHVAVVGLGGAFPGAPDIAAYWDNLVDGADCITRWTDDCDLTKVAARGRIGQTLDTFDPHLFPTLARQELRLLDPQLRLLLRSTWSALEDAGLDPRSGSLACGVFVSAGNSDYYERLKADRDTVHRYGTQLISLNSQRDFFPMKLSHLFGFIGPSMLIQSACSSSLTAVHTAVGSLLSYECDLAVAGGATVDLDETAPYSAVDGLMSRTGICRPFDAAADGTVPGSGGGVVVLKRLQSALDDGDRVYAVIAGSAVNNDGSHRASFTAPSAQGQFRAITEALELSGLKASDIEYVETHGTGTRTGDPVEAQALREVYGDADGPPCYLGAVKAHIGHLDAAAGIAGLIKTVLAVSADLIPPSHPIDNLNPDLDLGDRLRFADTSRPFELEHRAAAVSSLGFGGSNCHLIVAATRPDHSALSRLPGTTEPGSLYLSGSSAAAVQSTARRIGEHLQRHPDHLRALTDASAWLPALSWRAAVRTSTGQVVDRLRHVRAHSVVADATNVVLMFPGQGSFEPSNGRGLYLTDPTFGSTVRATIGSASHPAAAVLSGYFAGDHDLPERYEQAALYLIGIGLAATLRTHGVVPSMVVGHSVGELAAMATAGVFTAATGLDFVCRRGELLDSVARGAMTAVLADVSTVESMLGADLDIAAVNGSGQVVVSGPSPQIIGFEQDAAQRGIRCVRLRSPYAFHSRAVATAGPQLLDAASPLGMRIRDIAVLSSVDGRIYRSGDRLPPDYWSVHAQRPVRFDTVIDRLSSGPPAIVIDVGPGHTLTDLLGSAASPGLRVLALDTTGQAGDETTTVAQGLDRLWEAGLVESPAVSAHRSSFPLPARSFTSEHLWIQPPTLTGHTADHQPTHVPSEPAPRQRIPTARTSARPSDLLPPDLRSILLDVLDADEIDSAHSFTEMGGNSLLALQVTSRVRELFGTSPHTGRLLEADTISDYARELADPHQKHTSGPCEPEPNRTAGPATHSDMTTLPVPRTRDISGPAAMVVSFAQERMWFLDQLGAGSAYVVPLALRVTGAVNVGALRDAIRAVVDRHHVLRTVLRSDDHGVTAQLLDNISSSDTRLVRAVGKTGQDRWSWAIRWAQDFAGQPFDLAEGPLCRFGWIELGPDDGVLVMSLHHAVTDGWSTAVLCKDLSTAYQQSLRGERPRVDTSAMWQYTDFASWQREQWTASREQATTYWREQLDGLVPTELPTDRLRPRIYSHAGRGLRLSVDADLTQQVLTRARQEAVTPFVFLLSIYSAVVAARTDGPEVVLGTPVSGRARREWEDLVGLFVNTVVLRTQVMPDQTFRKLLGSVKDTVLQALRHQDMPFEELVRALDVTRDPSRNPIFQLLFAFLGGPETDPAAQLTLGAAAVAELELDEDAPADLNFQVWIDAEGRLQLKFVYATALFDQDTIERLAQHFVTAVRRVVTDPGINIRAVQKLPDSEHELVLHAWNGPAVAVDDRTVVDLFRAQVEATPQAHAVSTDESGSLTYAELDERSEALARFLRSRGVDRESVVGICLDRGTDMTVAVIAVLKAGGAYLPLDPAYPTARLTYMLRDTAAQHVLTHEPLRSTLPEPWSTTAFAIDNDWPSILHAAARTDQALPGPRPRDSAYVIYTSGSTGRPKGVVNEHRGLLNRLQWMRDHLGLDATDVVLQKTSFGFDVSVWEILAPLLVGARTHMARPGGQRDPHYLARAMASQRITTVHFVPTMLHSFLDHQPPAAPALRHVICSGEALPAAVANAARTHFGGTVHNLYGPTEAAIDVTAHHCVDTEHNPVPIGRPLWNTTVYVLDRSMEPVAVGVAGELYLGGTGVARGYLGRPALTAQHFVADPFTATRGARLYRTGDLARHRPDGSLEFLGRMDDQVKIRGHRVELGEVQAHLAAIPGITDCAVTGHGTSRGGLRLVGYYVADTAQPVTAGLLRKDLSACLPDYMVPSIFIELAAIPLTANGKLDRAALPAPEGRSHVDIDYIAPTTAPEKLLARIWAEVLHIDAIGTNDNFYELGGDSILSLLVVGKARQEGLAVTPQLILQFPTIGSLAEQISSDELARIDGVVVPPTGDGNGEVLLSPIQQRYLASRNDNPHHFNHSILLRARQPLDRAALTVALTAVL
ncbi:amino acid adenylation domain-containing protein, partial [Nocardia sp. NPDC050799]|uniref:non-ribosomal peptide synthetase/type I polyketide synthase n=1 Tax=Nocardia sp. NPDC050799 TaxID=3154842 RepID=UPI0033D002DC